MFDSGRCNRLYLRMGAGMLGGRPRLRLPRHRSLTATGLAAAFVFAGFGLSLAPASAFATLGPVLKPNVTAIPPWYVKTEELEWEGQKRELMRFNGWIGNQGPGRLEIRGRRNSPSEPMKVYQRLYREGAKETSGENEPDEYEEVFDEHAELKYDTADGFDLFHLMDIAHYSLWNYAKTEEAVPSQKVGFCLGDDEHLEMGKGPEAAFYVDPLSGHCDENKPEALTVREGISVGWDDLYGWELPLQWVDVSNVRPGEYWLRDDSDPAGFLVENGPPTEAIKHAYSTKPVTVLGYNALDQSATDENDEAKILTLSSEAVKGKWATEEVCKVSGNPRYEITHQPAHGKLGGVTGEHVTYTPEAGYEGSDSFTFVARNPNCRYPLQPTEATVSLSVTAPVVTTTTTTTTTASVTTTSTTVPGPAPSGGPGTIAIGGPAGNSVKAPTISALRQSASRWREGSRLARISKRARRLPIGTTFSFALDAQAAVSLSFTQRLTGREVGHKCVAKSRKNTKRKTCTRTVTVGRLSFTGHSATNKVVFQGRISRSKTLKPGRYTLIITATNSSGASAPQKLSFTIVQ
jgi:hypothetical protein